ncbi:winged helix-turn-helix domain-containing protein [Streptomyces sp. NBC_01515]|uniref:ArsR/SmtB family transcription factor n=1 Tax=Streptomyces sp. NBC_01515 TaxID=2903890 RepID=UPI00386538AE
MLRIHFTDADLVRTRMAAELDPLWEIGLSLHRFQTRQGRWAHAEWYRDTRQRLTETELDRVVRTTLLPLFPRAAYYPDFLNPAEAADGLDAGLAAIVATPVERIRREVEHFASITGAPAWAGRLVEREVREDLTDCLRRYYDTAIAPYRERAQARIEAERSIRARALLHGGAEALLRGLGPSIRWQAPVLHVVYPAGDCDLQLGGRGLLLMPSYFCWGWPIALADPSLPPVLVYPLLHEDPAPTNTAPLTVLLGRTRAVVLRATAAGATTGELARAAGVSAPAASQHTTALRDAGLISSHRHGPTVLHTLTPLGASLLRAATKRSR